MADIERVFACSQPKANRIKQSGSLNRVLLCRKRIILIGAKPKPLAHFFIFIAYRLTIDCLLCPSLHCHQY